MVYEGEVDTPAGSLASAVTARQNGAACAPLSHHRCPFCGDEEEDWTRNVEFATTTNNGDNNSILARVLFDTGASLDNVLSLEFVTQCNIAFDRGANAKWTGVPWWKRVWFRVLRKRPKATYYTADQRPITVVGVVESLRWRGINEPRCTSGLQFQPKFLDGRFLVVEGLAYNAIFSRKTMNDAGLRGPCHHTIAVIERPEPTQDPSAAERSKDAKKEQKRIQQTQEQEKRDDKGKRKAPGDK